MNVKYLFILKKIIEKAGLIYKIILIITFNLNEFITLKRRIVKAMPCNRNLFPAFYDC